METKRMRIVLKNRSKGTSITVFAQASLMHGTAKWERQEDIRFYLTPKQAKRVRNILCPHKDCEACVKNDLKFIPCSDTSIDDKDLRFCIMDDGSLNIYFHEPMGREGVIRILMRRNGMSREDAERECDQFKENALYMIEQGYPVWQVEEEFVSYFGVEPDYLIDFIM